MYIYSETGILIDRVDYKDLADKYGKPVCFSENGSVIIFRKSQDNAEIHIIMVHLDKLEFIGTVNIKKRIDAYFKNNLDLQNEEHLE